MIHVDPKNLGQFSVSSVDYSYLPLFINLFRNLTKGLMKYDDENA